jgi:hypothetical protein
MLEKVLEGTVEVFLNLNGLLVWKSFELSSNEKKTNDDRFFIERVIVSVLYFEVNDVLIERYQVRTSPELRLLPHLNP